ncbi:MAG: NAD(P)/FAD-dependent oxidoreductase [Planctomycetota bacterium]
MHDVIVVGAGAAGVGVAVALKDAGVTDCVVLEARTVGASFASWPAETRFITPSFPTNSIGMLDLNAVVIGASPGFGLATEHPTGLQFGVHLQHLVEVMGLPVREGTRALRITKVGDEFCVDTDDETLRARHVVWAVGEYGFPRVRCFEGSELCRHTATVARYGDLAGEGYAIIGGYESGVDAAYHLALRGTRVWLFDSGRPWASTDSDPSVSLSPYSLERMRDPRFKENVVLMPDTEVSSVTRLADGYTIDASNGQRFVTPEPPLLASGFTGGHRGIMHLFEEREEDGFPFLTDDDESTITPGLFLCGPAVRHGSHIFCFIYKYRQRFAVVAKAIATSLGLPAEKLEEYREWGMYLDDLSCCGEECIC